MKLCLDTNAYSAFKRGHAPLVEMLEEASDILVPSIVLGELHAGFALGSRTRENIRELTLFLDQPGVAVSAIDSTVAERYGQLVKLLKTRGTPIPTNDVWIAALTFELGARLVTYDKHFDKIPGLVIYAP